MIRSVSPLWILGLVIAVAHAEVGAKVKCGTGTMRIQFPLSAYTTDIYLQGLKAYPDPACRPHMDANRSQAVIELNLRDVYQCATTRVTNKLTGKQIYYQTVVVESVTPPSVETIRELFHVKCSLSPFRNHTIARRNVLPAGFQEPEELEITTSLTERAPEPVLGVGVRQGGNLVTGELNVSPGTPLQMEIFLDKTSAPIYGLLVTHMQVTDTKAQEETIIYNGCSVDPYLFENFNTIDGDFLSAKFRAFKFPESTYVQFKGTVNVCLDKCKGVECSDGQVGYGRRKRAISSLPADPNKIFEITITSFIKVNYEDGTENFEEVIRNQTKLFSDKKLIVGNQMTDDKKYSVFREETNEMKRALTDEERYTSIVAENGGYLRSDGVEKIIMTVGIMSVLRLMCL